ncbi:RagB/SusD family nutrient uptake outer membrane protein [Flavitalea sp. BT771]|uniref:RagB/SusD family nutrient uptake outer membrane protein n=1 Tax=Flavitalea sp. BT771 TaxID=3063329 RepID=UPI0026E2D336|nr:RagB/SusD family nutrient uptake outer membrane protein [Flavitalea sp. BT771]MDO6435252.1 RagB/SusD family nutrient uptake outer membrane protein [Flavitalea sp. BT771]MDV6224043.1 RagB/SusD family nutrient uptake outer membrane protein [Flavitalea sp. BT771]
MNTHKKIYVLMLAAAIVGPACNKQLKENPQSIVTPDFFKTAQGFQSGLDAAYAGMRNNWGTENLFTMTCIGTDEFITGNDGTGNNSNYYSSGYTPSDGKLTPLWNNAYTFINTCNGLIDFGPAIPGIDSAKKLVMLSEAKFLRANYYFILVQFWGNVTLNKHFQGTPTTAAKRDPRSDVYDFIVQDLKDAIAGLPASPTLGGVAPGKATAAAARHILAKVYLTRASSPAAHADDYQNAYAMASGLINDRASLGLDLLPDFGSVFQEGNETNKEVLWTVQHTSNIAYNGSATQNSSGPDNVLVHMWVPKYETEVPGMQRDILDGRPYIRAVPTRWLTDTVFKERVNDTRYSKTFQTVWYANNGPGIPKWPSPVPPGVDPSLAGQPRFALGDTACYMPGVDVSDATIKATRYLLIPPRKYNIKLSPYMRKYVDTKRPDMNSPSIRPVIVWTLSETYLIAAEAAYMMNQPTTALGYINTIRERAAYPTGNAAAMDVTEADLSLDFILNERSRELCGQMVRWWDLVRTHQLLPRVIAHNSDGRFNIVPKDTLRPIPQTQMNAVTSGDPYGPMGDPLWN